MRQTLVRHGIPRFALATLTVLAVSLLALPVMAEEMTLEAIIAKNIESRGGMEAIKAVQSAKLVGTMSMGGNMEAPFVMLSKRPHKLRMEFVVQGMTGIQAYDGQMGWAEMPFMGNPEPQKMADDQLKQTRQQADIDGPMVDWQEKGHKIELLGKVDVDGTEAYKLKITLADGDEIVSYLDTEYCLEFRQERKISIQGNVMDLSLEIGDYKEVGDLVMPHSYEQRFAGAPVGQTITIQAVELGVEVADELFTMPVIEEKVEAAAAGGR